MCTYKRLLYTSCMHSYWRDLVTECQLQKEYNASGLGATHKCPIHTPPATIGSFERNDKCPTCQQAELRIAELRGLVDKRARQIQHDIAKDSLQAERLRGVTAGLDDLKSQMHAQSLEMAAIYGELRGLLDGAAIGDGQYVCSDYDAELLGMTTSDDDTLGTPSPATMCLSPGGERRSSP